MQVAAFSQFLISNEKQCSGGGSFLILYLCTNTTIKKNKSYNIILIFPQSEFYVSIQLSKIKVLIIQMDSSCYIIDAFMSKQHFNVGLATASKVLYS